MKLSIIILNYNTFDMTCDCIKSIYESSLSFQFEIILIDNASQERDAVDFVSIFPKIVLIKNKNNSGFAIGNNLGLAVAQGEYVLLLNSDTLVNQQAIQHCVDFLDEPSNQNVGVAGCKLCYSDGVVQHSAFDHKFGLRSTMLNNLLVNAVRVRLNLVHDYTYIINNQHATRYKEAILGAYILCRSKIVKEVGGLDADFFMYSEELEWCYRITRAGHKIAYLPEASIIHFYGGSSTTSSDITVEKKLSKQNALSKLLLIYKRHGKIGLLLYNAIWAINKLTLFLFSLKYSHKQLAGYYLNVEEFNYSKQYQKVMIGRFKPSTSSSNEPFSVTCANKLMS